MNDLSRMFGDCRRVARVRNSGSDIALLLFQKTGLLNFRVGLVSSVRCLISMVQSANSLAPIISVQEVGLRNCRLSL